MHSFINAFTCNWYVEIDAINKFSDKATAIYKMWLQKWIFFPYVFRRQQSGDVTQEFIPVAVLLCCAVPANYGTLPYSLIFTPIAALLQAVLQANTKTVPGRPSRNEEQSSINEEQTRNKPSYGPKCL